jgi:hypothetical protein
LTRMPGRDRVEPPKGTPQRRIRAHPDSRRAASWAFFFLRGRGDPRTTSSQEAGAADRSSPPISVPASASTPSRVRALPILLLLAAAQSAGCKSDSEAAAETEPAPRGPVPVLQFAAVADVDERKEVTEHVYADDTVRLRPPRAFEIQDARLAHDQNGYPAVLFVIADAEKEEFRRWTGTLVRRKMAMLIDGRVIAVPKVNSALPGAGIVVDDTRHWTVEEATALAERIRDRAASGRK